MTTRRELIAGALAAGLPVSALGRPKRPSVQAEVTIFYGHPGAETVLVRFYVLDVDAPAGRLRVFDRSGRRILGTAAVLASGGRMFGELWLPIRARTEILTELEAPGLSRPLRSSHIIQPLPRWTVHWLIIINQAEIEATLAAAQPTQNTLRNAVLQSMGAQINPLKNNDPMALDHYSFLSQGRSAAHLSQLTGLPVSQTAIGPSALFGLRTAPRIFKAFGVSNGVIEPSAAGPDFGRLVSIDGSPFPLAFLHADATPQNLGFYDGRDAMSRNVERWLTRTPAFRAPQYEPRVAVMASTTLDDRLGDVSDAIQEWNRLYAYPRIETGRADLLFQRTPPRISTSSAEPAPFRPPPGPTIEEIIAANAQRQQDVESNSANALLALLKVADLEGGTAVSLAENIETNWPGLVVFNPSPFPRTEVIDMPDGSVRVAHSVPSHGYSYLPDIGSEAGTAVEDPGAMIARGQHVTIRLDPETGAIASLFHRDRRTEWVRSDSEGLNAIEDSRLESFTRIRLDRVGVRLVAVRSVSGATMITTITVYDDLPW
ncbi:MAG: hypothetical protein OEZ54_12240, partial [Gemmatimonadota bacterium]|nr:hypothetical protein [Gemmatimonadota bacterium]